MPPKRAADGKIDYYLGQTPGVTSTESARNEALKDIALQRARATDKQVELALSLLHSRGFNTVEMEVEMEMFGFRFEVGTLVGVWLACLSVHDIGVLIEDLMARPIVVKD